MYFASQFWKHLCPRYSMTPPPPSLPLTPPPLFLSYLSVCLCLSGFSFLLFPIWFLVAGLYRTGVKYEGHGHVRRTLVCLLPTGQTVPDSPRSCSALRVWLSFTSAPEAILSWCQCMSLLFDSKPALPSPCPRLRILLISVMYVSPLFFPIKKPWDENCFDI